MRLFAVTASSPGGSCTEPPTSRIFFRPEKTAGCQFQPHRQQEEVPWEEGTDTWSPGTRVPAWIIACRAVPRAWLADPLPPGTTVASGKGPEMRPHTGSAGAARCSGALRFLMCETEGGNNTHVSQHYGDAKI